MSQGYVTTSVSVNKQLKTSKTNVVFFLLLLYQNKTGC